MQGQIVYFI